MHLSSFEPNTPVYVEPERTAKSVATLGAYSGVYDVALAMVRSEAALTLLDALEMLGLDIEHALALRARECAARS